MKLDTYIVYAWCVFRCTTISSAYST